MADLSQTDVSFLTGVPFDNSYAHTRWFESKSEQYSYFKSFEKYKRTFNNFQKINGKYYIDVSQQVEDLMDCNYLMFKNSKYSNKWFYCFITNVTHIQRNLTRVHFEVDVIQTWCFDITFKPSFIAREHETQSNNWNVVPEGIGIGNEYEIVKQYDVKPLPFYFMAVCVKERFDLDYESQLYDGTFYGSPNTLSYYFIPVPYSIVGEGPLPSYRIKWGDNFYEVDINNVRKLFHELRNNEKAPKNIVSIFVTDFLPFNINLIAGSSRDYTIDGVFHTYLGSDNIEVFCLAESTSLNATLEKNVGNVFADINESASKLRFYPYTLIEMSDGRGNVVNFKPEGLKSTNGNIGLTFLSSIYFSNWVAYAMKGYNGAKTRAELLGNALINSDPQDIAVLDDRTTAYLQGAKNSLEAQKRTWQTDLKYQKISNTIRGTSSLANIGANAAMKNTNPSAYIDDVANVAQSYTNYMKAGEDYQNRVNEQNAMLEDIDNQPPNLIKQGSNGNAGAGNGLLGVRITIKRPRKDYLDKARYYFHVFGYKSNAFKVPNLHTRRYFNYVQTTMCNIQCKFYNDDILRIKSIFDSGITLWHTNDMYNYDVVNEEV